MKRRTHDNFTRSMVMLLLVMTFALPLWAAPAATDSNIAMRDGVKLNTLVYLPEGEGPWPVVFMRTPYAIQMVLGIAPPTRYLTADYAYVLQSSRGTGKSEGKFSPFSHARLDGKDTLDWITKQSFCNGDIGLSGASAMGITANYAASVGHPSVRAAFIMVAPHSSFEETTFMGGVFKQAQVSQWMNLQKAPEQIELLRARPVMDEEWKQIDLPSHIDKINIPIYNVGGWFDIFQNGTLTNFEYLQYKGADGARGKQKVRVGAFGHMDLGGDLAFTEGGALGGSTGEDEIRWFDHWLKGKDNGIDREPPVEYFLMASARKGSSSEKNRVVRAASWPPTSKQVPYYLQADFGLSPGLPSQSESSNEYLFDPKKPVRTVGGANLFLPCGPMDQRAIGERGDYLRFQTDPLADDVTVVGNIVVELFASTDGPDTDFMVKLVDVYPDGYEALLLDAPIRARYRDGRNPEDVSMMTPGKPEKMTINLWSTANVFEKGHRIAVHVTSSNSPRFEVNPNTGHAPGESRSKTRVATNTIHHSSKYPSALILPVVVSELTSSTD